MFGSRGMPTSLLMNRNSSGSLKNIQPSPGGNGVRVVNTPITAIGSATTKPANGPASPMSNNARREGIAERILINAPKVPARNSGGAGMKYGGVAFTL